MTDTQAPAPGTPAGAPPEPPADRPSVGADASSATGGGVPHAGLRLAALLAALVALGLWNPWMLVVILALVFMITLHELGHYLTAKRAGMKVTEFFLFFGPKIWSIKRGETEYGIKCIPAGAYVKVIGMTNLEEVPPEDEARTYRQKSFGERISVAVAGSTMHFLLALALIFAALVGTGVPAGSLDPGEQASDWTIASVVEGSGAEAAGLQPGDKVVRLAGEPIDSFDDLRTVASEVEGDTVPLAYRRDGEVRTTEITLEPFYTWSVARVVPGSGPAEAGLEVGDDLTSIDGTPTRGIEDLDELLASVEGRTVPVELERAAEDGTVRTAEAEVEVESLVLAGYAGYLGVGRERPENERVGPLEGIVEAPRQFVRVASLSLQGLASFFSPSGIADFVGQVGDARDENPGVEGPTIPSSNATSSTLLDTGSSTVGENRILSIYGLVRIGSDTGKVDPGSLVALFAVINIFIGMFNLVPLLPFDGGHVVLAVYEKIQEKRLNRRRYFADAGRLLPVINVVVVALGLLFLSSLYLDIANPLT